MRRLCASIPLLILSACVSFPNSLEPVAPAVVAGNVIQTVDGKLLGARQWRAAKATSVIIAIHGMNDYSFAFDGAATWWAKNASITTYGMDQRGHGASPNFGHWAGAAAMKADIRSTVAAVRALHPEIPIFLLGHSMGAGAIMAAEAEKSTGASGLILAAPGVWGGRALPFPYRWSAEITASIAPNRTLTGERAGRQATDNIDILRIMGRDPRVIKETRLDAVVGVVRLMGEAYEAPEAIKLDVLFLIGEKDEIIPVKMQEKAAARFAGPIEIKRYREGWHLLFRDIQAENVWRDVADWVGTQHNAISARETN